MHRKLQKNAIPIAISLALGALTANYVSHKVTIREYAKTKP